MADYERINWDTTMYVNPENMNKMDKGIKDACDGVNENSTAISEVNSNLSYKTDRPKASIGEYRAHVVFGDSTTGNQCYSSMIPLPMGDKNYNITLTDVHVPWYAPTYQDICTVVKDYYGFWIYASDNTGKLDNLKNQSVEIRYRIS